VVIGMSGQKKKGFPCAQCNRRVLVEGSLCASCAPGESAAAALYTPATMPTHPTDEAQNQRHRAIQDSLTALYSPTLERGRSASSSAVTSSGVDPQSMGEAPTRALPLDQAHEGDPIVMAKWGFWALLLGSVGVQLFLFGFLQWLWATDGVVRLEWNSRHWPWCCIVAAPLLAYARRAYKRL